jgi:hypothetical protein
VLQLARQIGKIVVFLHAESDSGMGYDCVELTLLFFVVPALLGYLARLKLPNEAQVGHVAELVVKVEIARPHLVLPEFPVESVPVCLDELFSLDVVSVFHLALGQGSDRQFRMS